MPISQEIQKLDPSAPISLFTLDATSIGGPVLHFSMQSQANGNDIVFGGIAFTPLDIRFDGLETTGVGALPQPSMKLANTDGVVQAIVNTYGDLNGCLVQRVRTYARFLDGQPSADPTAFFGPDIFAVEQKTAETPTDVIWTLSAAIDQQGKMIPGRVIVRDTCMWRYRVWNPNTATFDYAKAQCPYTGAQAYDINDLPTTPDKDYPSRRLSCCKARFGDSNPLPFGGFPGVARSMS